MNLKKGLFEEIELLTERNNKSIDEWNETHDSSMQLSYKKKYSCKKDGYKVLLVNPDSLKIFDKKYLEYDNLKIVKNSLWEFTREENNRIYLKWIQGGYENIDKNSYIDINIPSFEFEEYFAEKNQ